MTNNHKHLNFLQDLLAVFQKHKVDGIEVFSDGEGYVDSIDFNFQDGHIEFEDSRWIVIQDIQRKITKIKERMEKE